MMVALLLIAYTVGLWLGETLQETIFPKDSRKQNFIPVCLFSSNSSPILPLSIFSVPPP